LATGLGTVLPDVRLAAGQDVRSLSWTRAAEAFSPVAGPLPAQGQHDDDDDDDKDDGPDADIHGGFPLAGRLKTPMSCPWHGDPNRLAKIYKRLGTANCQVTCDKALQMTFVE
jgi:hypothetical protein